MLIIDEASEKITGAIDVTPTRMVQSKDRKRFYLLNASAEQVEILDIASGKSVDHFMLSEGRKKVRIRNLIADPLDRFVIMLVKGAEKKVDRFEISYLRTITLDADMTTELFVMPDAQHALTGALSSHH